MTFIEAATYVLEREGRPLRSKEIAEKAVALGILSHVGKTPVQTMFARLSAAVAKGRDASPFVRVRPGVFGLQSWKGKPPQPSKQERARQPAPQADAGQPTPPKSPLKSATGTPPRNSPRAGGAQNRTPAGIPAESQGGSDTLQPKKRKRKRRKTAHSPALATETPSRVQPQTGAPERAAPQADEGLRGGSRPSTHHSPDSAGEPPGSRTLPASAPSPEPERSVEKPLLARTEDIVDHIESILKKSARPLPVEQVYEQVGLKSEAGSLLIDAIVAADGFERTSKGLRPRFVKHKNGYGLMEREMSSEILTLEKQAFEVRTRLHQIAERQVLKKLRGLTMSGFVRVMILYLQRSGFGAIVPVDLSRPGEFHLSVQDRRHHGRFRTAVVLRRDSADFTLSNRTVMDLRGAIHHYDAMGGMILTTGQVSDEAVAEGRIPNLAPVAIIDGATIAKEMVRLGIGIKDRSIQLPTFDELFFSGIES
jgi:hypothetical protein